MLCAALEATKPGPDLNAAGPVTTDDQMLAALNLDGDGLQKVKVAATVRDLAAVKEAYLDFRRRSSAVKWRGMPADQPAPALRRISTALRANAFR